MELKILVAHDENGGGRTVQVVPRDGSPSRPRPFALPLQEADHGDLRWYLEDFMDLPFGGSAMRAAGVETRLEAWGRTVFDAVFGSGVERDLMGDLLRAEGQRLLTVVTSDPAAMRIPWELTRRGDRLLFQDGVTIRRQVESTLRADGHALAFPIRILLVISRPEDLGFIDPRYTTPAVLDALDPLRKQGLVTLEFCRPPTMARMEAMLESARHRGEPYQVIHFEGHGIFLPDLGQGALCFERDGGQHDAHTVGAGRLGSLLASHGVHLVILEACHSGQVSEHTMFHSVAPRLVSEGVASVVAMTHAVHVEAARILLSRFYEVLAGGGAIGAALDSGRRALWEEPGRWTDEPGPYAKEVSLQDWFLPVLYQRTSDDPVPFPRLGGHVLTATGDGAAGHRAPATGQQTGAFPSHPRYGFHGRARELHQLERVFEQSRGVLVHGMGGDGQDDAGHRGGALAVPDGAVPRRGVLLEL